MLSLVQQQAKRVQDSEKRTPFRGLRPSDSPSFYRIRRLKTSVKPVQRGIACHNELRTCFEIEKTLTLAFTRKRESEHKVPVRGLF